MRVDLGGGVFIETTPTEWAVFSQISGILKNWTDREITHEQARWQIEVLINMHEFIESGAAEEDNNVSKNAVASINNR